MKNSNTTKGAVRDLGLTPLDDLFSTEAQRQEAKLPRIYDIPLSEIDDFPDHPYKVRKDEDMDALVESIRERGVITPITLRTKEDGRYEIVSGHRRRKACEIAGMETIKAEVRELTRDEAIILMVDANVQRSSILPSEKAFAYKMKLEALKRQAGRPSKENSAPVGQNLAYDSRALLAEQMGDSHSQIQRYIRLTYLTPKLLDLVDGGRIALRPAVELSYLPEEEQAMLLETIASEDATPSLTQARKMRSLSLAGELSMDRIFSIMTEVKANQVEKISFPMERIRGFFPGSYTPKQIEEALFRILEDNRKREARRAAREAR